MAADTDSPSLDDVLQHIRPAVRDRSEYIVDMPEGIDVKLNQNESPFDLPAGLKQELLDAHAQVEMNRYPSEQPEALRHALAEYDGVDPDQILVGNGSNEITYTFGLAFLDPGDPVVLPRPMFSLYEKVMRLQEADLTIVPPQDDFGFDADALATAAAETDAVLTILTTPNNPTGLAMTLDELEQVVTASSGFVVIDEAYVEFNPEGTAIDLLEQHPNVLILRTLSKGFGLAGARLGYLLAHPAVVTELMKARLPFMVDRFAEQTALAVLRRPDLIEDRVSRIEASITTLTEALQAMEGVEVVPSQANFVVFTTPLPADTLQDRLADRGVLVRNMGGYPELEGYLRVSAGTEEENNAFLDALDVSLEEAGAISEV
ncbi:histidinol-phosphate transaminase [Salinibacter ruber]|jgi:histidinol-phosphate aminotransferase|uniref:Histidinol-phosphate aminotransferase n=1 Tax=Salinibacter ruber TaxID=146919 RepID=A0A9X2PR75_9BACT|nr:histidinol-phosphate transaminase [Salinibacter ruber]MBB4088360.1 histidinol-phosphate aminotransferase [Salinibacter ruber]MCS3611161.1 histidinol-phosphate aminotransferase [Salinibacter ruber]MCS3614475.1 histidinol-phosphate aminotransferase [Salinibacter ruber]MCS3628414.1 histidinol-phosphate aminotransferase [Salinibacter ruber]MCS3646271.1 histidinol-phosphate aminotransferase [Salinibacter ruber]